MYLLYINAASILSNYHYHFCHYYYHHNHRYYHNFTITLFSTAYPTSFNPIQQALLQNAAIMSTAQKEGNVLTRHWSRDIGGYHRDRRFNRFLILF